MRAPLSTKDGYGLEAQVVALEALPAAAALFQKSVEKNDLSQVVEAKDNRMMDSIMPSASRS